MHKNDRHTGTGLLLSCFAVLLFCSAEIVGQVADGRVNDVAFTSRLDGSTQSYVEMLPECSREPLDVIIGLHGHGADRWQFVKDPRAECRAFRVFAARHRMVAISPDYRARTSWMGPAAEKDLLQIIEEVRKKYPVRHIFLAGASMGGASALTFAVLHPDLIAGVAAMNAHANHLEYTNFQDSIAASFGGLKQLIPEEYKKRSAEYWPERLPMPVAFTVGLADTIVPPCSVIRLAGILQNLDKDVLLLKDQTGGHETNFEDAMTVLEYMMNNIDNSQE